MGRADPTVLVAHVAGVVVPLVPRQLSLRPSLQPSPKSSFRRSSAGTKKAETVQLSLPFCVDRQRSVSYRTESDSDRILELNLLPLVLRIERLVEIELSACIRSLSLSVP